MRDVAAGQSLVSRGCKTLPSPPPARSTGLLPFFSHTGRDANTARCLIARRWRGGRHRLPRSHCGGGGAGSWRLPASQAARLSNALRLSGGRLFLSCIRLVSKRMEAATNGRHPNLSGLPRLVVAMAVPPPRLGAVARGRCSPHNGPSPINMRCHNAPTEAKSPTGREWRTSWRGSGGVFRVSHAAALRVQTGTLSCGTAHPAGG